MLRYFFLLIFLPKMASSQQIYPLNKNLKVNAYKNYANLSYIGDLKSPIGFAFGNEKGTFFFIGTMKGFGKKDYTNIISPSTPTTVYRDEKLGEFTERYILGYLRSIPVKNINNFYFDFGGGVGGLVKKQSYYDATGILSPNNTYTVGDNKSEIEFGVIGGVSYYSGSLKYNLALTEYTRTGFGVMFGLGFLLFK